MIDAAAAEGDEPVQMKVHKSLKLWSFYVDLEESLGTLDSTRAVYERILDLRIATPQIILNYAYLLEVISFSKFSMFYVSNRIF
jgi:pre-mRNA-splicing factor SYF1